MLVLMGMGMKWKPVEEGKKFAIKVFVEEKGQLFKKLLESVHN